MIDGNLRQKLGSSDLFSACLYPVVSVYFRPVFWKVGGLTRHSKRQWCLGQGAVGSIYIQGLDEVDVFLCTQFSILFLLHKNFMLSTVLSRRVKPEIDMRLSFNLVIVQMYSICSMCIVH